MNKPYLLQEGDIIRLEKGMKVYDDIPEKFVYRNTPFSAKLAHHDIRIGQKLFKDGPHEKSKLIGELTQHIKNYLHCDDINKENVEILVNSLNLSFAFEEFDTSVFVGEYRVTQTSFGGGGSYREMNGRIESYPDGWHVFCQKVGQPDVCVDFYQTGCFTAMIPDIMPIKREK